MSIESSKSLKTDLSRLIEGRVSEEPAELAAVAVDYGGLQRREPSLLVRPASALEVARVMEFAYANDLPMTARAGGFSFAGQTLNEGGIVIDTRDLRGVERVDAEREEFTAQGGTPWKDVVVATTREGFVPPVLTSYLGTTLGGTLSAAGFGMSSALHGTQVDHCLELEVALCDGSLARCSEDENRELFEHVLCGFGQFGVITRARLKMRRAAPRVRTYFLQYDELRAHLDDQARLIEEKRISYLDGMVRSCYHGLRVSGGQRVPFHTHLYPMNITVEAGPDGSFDDDAALAGLGFSKWVYAEDLSLADFLLVGHTEEISTPKILEIFVDVLVPWSVVEDFIRKVEAHIFPRIVHVEHTILWPMTKATLKRPLLKTPDAAMFMGIGLYSRVPIGAGPATLEASRAYVDLALRMGGTYYLTGSVRYDAARFEKAFGDRWPAVREVKRRYDPKGLLNPGFFKWS